MKKVLCFGDSNTYGYNPKTGGRYDKNTRWTGILQSLAVNSYEIIEAGCNNRTAFSDNPYGIQMTGYKILPSYLDDELSSVIIQIGINDLQNIYNPSLDDFKAGMESFINIVCERCPSARLILLSPSVLKDCILKCHFGVMFNETSIEKSKLLTPVYKTLAEKYSCKFIDLNEFTETSDVDGLHYEPSEHKKIALAVFEALMSK